MTSTIRREIDTVNSRQQLSYFLEKPAGDFSSDKECWQSYDIDDYLETLAAWLQTRNAEDYDAIAPETWRLVAALFYMGKIYE